MAHHDVMFSLIKCRADKYEEHDLAENNQESSLTPSAHPKVIHHHQTNGRENCPRVDKSAWGLRRKSLNKIRLMKKSRKVVKISRIPKFGFSQVSMKSHCFCESSPRKKPKGRVSEPHTCNATIFSTPRSTADNFPSIFHKVTTTFEIFDLSQLSTQLFLLVGFGCLQNIYCARQSTEYYSTVVD